MSTTIWVVNKYSSGHEDGFETRTMAIAREWVRAGHRVVVFCSNANHLTGNQAMSAPVDHRVLDGVEVIRLRTLRYARTGSIKRVLSWLDFERRLLTVPTSSLPTPDVIIASSLSIFSVIGGWALSRRHGAPWVFEVRDIWPLTLVEEGGVSRWHPFALLLAAVERFGYATCNLVIGTMPNLKAHVQHVISRDVQVECIPFGFNPSGVPDALPTTPALGTDSAFTIGYAGSIGISNALDTLIACAQELRDDARFRFVIAGDGDRRAALMHETRDMPHVTWLGRIPRAAVHDVLSGCDLLYFSAHRSKVWQYGMSLNKLTDYLLAARPILGSYTGFPSILDEAGCGRFIPAGDVGALREALESFRAMSPHTRTEMGNRGREWLFANRTWARIARDYHGLLAGLATDQSLQGRAR